MTRANKERLAVALLLASLAFVAHFRRLGDFGLYEDDWALVATGLTHGPSSPAQVVETIAALPQGRPLHFILIRTLSWLGAATWGLRGCYLLAWCIVALNSFLVFVLVRRRRAPDVALVAAIVYCVLPADTTKILLTHALGIQPAMTLLLLSLLLYDRGRRAASFLPAALGLLTYETVFPPFAVAPLLAPAWPKRRPGGLARHAAAVAAVLLTAAAVRLLLGEGRALHTLHSLGATAWHILAGAVLGPAANAFIVVWGPMKTLSWWNVATVASAVLGAALVAIALHLTGRSGDGTGAGPGPSAHTPPPGRDLELLGAGIAALVLGYALSFTHYPPIAPAGRGTSVHIAAGLGMSLVCAWLAERGLRCVRRGCVAAVRVGLALGCGVLVGYHATIQDDFARAWRLERAFWRQVLALCPDITGGTVIIHEMRDPGPTRFIRVNSWADPLVLDLLIALPVAPSQSPRLFSLPSAWRRQVESAGGGLRWPVPRATWPAHEEELPRGNVIILHDTAAGLVRVAGGVELAGRTLWLKPKPPPGTPAAPPGPLAGLLAATALTDR